jgi:hypothetical protein
MANRNAPDDGSFSSREKKAQQLLATCLRKALVKKKCTQRAAALSMQIAKRTVGAWVRGEQPVKVAKVIASRRLGRAFREALCTFNHESEDE